MDKYGPFNQSHRLHLKWHTCGCMSSELDLIADGVLQGFHNSDNKNETERRKTFK